MRKRWLRLSLLAIVAGLAGCGGGRPEGELSFAATKSCFEAKGYATRERTDLGALRPTYADEWYTVRSHGADFLAVAFFKNADRASEARTEMKTVAKNYAKTAGVTVTDETLNAVIRTAGNTLYWWKANSPVDERQVEACLSVKV